MVCLILFAGVVHQLINYKLEIVGWWGAAERVVSLTEALCLWL